MIGTWSLRTRIVVLAMVSLLPILAVVAYIIYQSLENTLDQMIETEIFISDTVAQGLETTFEDNSSVLQLLATSDPILDTIAISNGTVPADPARVNANIQATTDAFQNVFDFRRNVNGLFLMNQQGQVIDQVKGGTVDPAAFPEAISATAARSATTGEMAVSGALSGPADSSGFIALTFPVFGPDQTSGQVTGIVGAFLSVDRLRQTFTPFAQGNTIIMVIADRQIVTTNAAETERTPLLNAYLNSGTTEQIFEYEGINDVSRVGVSATVDIGDSSPWTVVVTNPTPLTYGSTQAVLQRGVIGIVLAVLLTLLLAWLLATRTVRPLDRLARQATNLANGSTGAADLPPLDAHGGREVRQVNAAVRVMGEQLSGQVRELESSHRLREEQAGRLRDLNRRNVRTMEEERRRIAGEIHDAVSPLITGALYQSRALLMDTTAPDPARQRDGLSDIGGLLTSASDELHRVIFDLRPPDLDDLGVVAAIERYISNFSRGGMSTPTITVTGQEPPGLTPEIRVTVYRIVQEALHNIVRHSGADEAVVQLDTFDGQFQVMIRDNGAGFDPEQASRPTSLGLLSMRERAAAIGATLHIESTPGLGTSVILDRKMTAGTPTSRRPPRRVRPVGTEVARRPGGAGSDAGKRADPSGTAVAHFRTRLMRKLNSVAGF
ncbi:MAG TPA: ATP-binding protein [Thermomicrobiales bacterium]|jgi:signal transduction histidine kinase|nr:ATP-binding protein [Thermomicrobiales bacterium]